MEAIANIVYTRILILFQEVTFNPPSQPALKLDLSM